jgi:hypothetical protein
MQAVLAVHPQGRAHVLALTNGHDFIRVQLVTLVLELQKVTRSCVGNSISLS